MSQPTTPLPKLEADLERLLSAIESADDPTEAFAQFKTRFAEYRSRSADLREDWYRQRNTIQRQAQTIAEAEIDELTGERAPHSHETAPSLSVNLPEILAIETAPNCLFCRLSFGYVNLLQIALLDVPARQLYLTSGAMRNLETADLQILIFQLQLYPAAK